MGMEDRAFRRSEEAKLLELKDKAELLEREYEKLQERMRMAEEELDVLYREMGTVITGKWYTDQFDRY